ncbi:MAG: threonylcarbamoyl-AMP synthase [Deltaproteobacteria bacterium]|nr:threonylcarbamoyl-AMP synthase [Deltaproteobacteria bacterium]
MSAPWEEAALALRRGELVIYPTETFYALGCLATLPKAVERVFYLKDRPLDKPLPLILADWDMVARFTRLDQAALALAQVFWPGPLSIVTPVVAAVCSLAKDGFGRSAVRMTPHPLARALCRAAGAPLVSSSANKSGQAAVADPHVLDVELAQSVLVLDARPWPEGRAPSTLVELVDADTVRILRPGALSREDFARHGYVVAM